MDRHPRPTKPRGPSARTKITVALAAIGVAGGVWAGSTVVFDRPATASVAQVRLEPTSSAGANPFMSPVGVDQANVSPPPGSAGNLSGDTPGLYADNGDKPSCDASTLTADLNADPAKAKAWAEALGITTEEIPAYVASLTPMVLRSDTAVTSYGYENGSFSAYPAVLQAGTSVFVNGHGEPRVKCFSGNPLTEAASMAQASYVGTGWGHFQPGSVTTIQRAPGVIKDYTVINVQDGRPESRPGKPPWNGGDDGGYCPKHPEDDKCPLHGVYDVLLDNYNDAQAAAEQAAAAAATARTNADLAQAAATAAATEAQNRAAADAAKHLEVLKAQNAALKARVAMDDAEAAYKSHPSVATSIAWAIAKAKWEAATAYALSKGHEREETLTLAAQARDEAQARSDEAELAKAAAISAEQAQADADAEVEKAGNAIEDIGGEIPNPTPVPPREPQPEDTQVKPQDTQVKPQDKQDKPEDTQVKPQDKQDKPEDTQVKPQDKPEDTQVKPEDTQVKPQDTQVKPEDTQVKPQDKQDKSEDTEVKPQVKPQDQGERQVQKGGGIELTEAGR